MSSNQNKMSRIISLSALVILLGACSTTVENEPEVPEVMNMYDNRYRDSGYGQLAAEMSDTNVQLYGLDGNGAPARPLGRKSRTAQGMTTSDPSVTVFPLDGGAPSGQRFRAPQQNRNDYSARRGDDSVPAPSTSSEDSAFAGNKESFVPMTRKAPSQRGRNEVAQFSTMPSRIYFSHDSTALTSSGRDVVDHVANAYQGQNLSVEGHASERAEQQKTVERKITNLKVSMDRALSVSRALMYKGIPAESIETKAYGDTKPPLAPQGMSPEAAARRVEIFSR